MEAHSGWGNARAPRDTAFFGFGLTLAVLVVGGVLGYLSAQRLASHNRQVAHTHDVLASLQQLQLLVTDAETGQRGYLLADDEGYLQPYNEAVALVNAEVQRLRQLTSDNADQQQRLHKVESVVDLKLAELERTVKLARDGDRASALVIVGSNVGREVMRDVRDEIAAMQQIELALLRQRGDESEASFNTTVLSILLTSLLGVLLVIAAFVLTRRNIAQRQRAATLLGAERERLRITLASIGDAVISTDTSGRVTYLNPVAECLTGWSNAEAAGNELSTVFEIVNETTRATVDNPALRALREGVIVGLANHTMLIAKDGSERPIDDSAAPIRDSQGNITGAVLVFRDVTERRRTENSLRQMRDQLEQRVAERTAELAHANQFLHVLLENLQEGIVACDASGTLTLFNEATRQFHGLPEEPIPADRWAEHYDLFHPDGQSRMERDEIPLFRALRGEHIKDAEMVIARAERPPLRLVASGRAFHDDEGRPLGAVVSMHDITRRKQAEDALQLAHNELEQRVALRTAELAEANAALQREISVREKAEEALRRIAADLSDANRRKTEFLATLGHELRNPLAPIRAGLEALKSLDGDMATREEVRGMMERQALQMVRLIDDLLDMSRITQGKLELRTCPVSLADVVQSAVEATRPLIDEAGHRLTVSLPTQPIELHADPNRLAQVFSNLLNNSCKYTPDGGRISLAAERDRDSVVVVVRDNGIGIPASLQQDVFEMFAQIDRPLEKGYKGFGIGLTLVKRLVEMHGGAVEVQSDGAGEGSEFRVRLPITRAAPAPAVEQPPTEAIIEPAKLRVLVVDDNADGATMLAIVVRTLGHEVRTASDGLEAVATAANFHPHVVLMDLGMPRMNGYEAARHMRAQAWGQSMRLVALTGWGQDEDKQRTKDAGFDLHLVKPADPVTLRKLLAEVRPPSE